MDLGGLRLMFVLSCARWIADFSTYDEVRRKETRKEERGVRGWFEEEERKMDRLESAETGKMKVNLHDSDPWALGRCHHRPPPSFQGLELSNSWTSLRLSLPSSDFFEFASYRLRFSITVRPTHRSERSNHSHALVNLLERDSLRPSRALRTQPFLICQ